MCTSLPVLSFFLAEGLDTESTILRPKISRRGWGGGGGGRVGRLLPRMGIQTHNLSVAKMKFLHH